MNNLFATPKRLSIAFCQRTALPLLGAAAMTFSLWTSPTLAGDPFRPNSPYRFGDTIEGAFNALFKEGNYRAAASLLQQAETQEPNEPLVYAMKASLAYTDLQAAQKNKTLLDSFKSYTAKTREAAERLKATNPLRGNLYVAVSYGLEAAAVMQEEGALRGVPKALNKLQQVYQSLEAAEQIAPQDPELNLLKGWMDLLISVNLPFSDPTQAIARLEKAAPAYLASWGMAVGYRDLKQYDKALEYVDRALQATPNHPELHYLKAQILVRQNRQEEAKQHFNVALAKSDQLPKGLVAQIFFEQCRNQYRQDKNKRAQCDPLRDPIREVPGQWGPRELPKLD